MNPAGREAMLPSLGAPGADVLFVSAGGSNLFLPPYGTLLCDLPFLVDPFPTTAGVPFAIPVPNNCAFVGITICAQVVSIDGGGTMLLTNALDLTIGAS